MLAWHISDRQQHQAPVRDEPAVPPAVAAVLSVLRSSAVIVDDSDVVLKASAPAYAMALVRGTSLVSDELAALVSEVRRDGQIRETELVDAAQQRPVAPRHRAGRAAGLADGARRWSRTAPASAASRRSAATSSPTSATS